MSPPGRPKGETGARQREGMPMNLRHAMLRRVAAGLIGVLAAPCILADSHPLADLSLDELSNLEITSVSRRRELLSEAPASIFVITSEALRRSGAATLPEALRLAPNLQVARITASQYAVSARGFNNAIGNKLLVLIDGRTVYTPFFSGVFWDQQDVMLQDVDRIEVISGPGATLWGSNAVNGVINVITRAASETQGSLVSLTAGNGLYQLAARHGGGGGEGPHWRLYGKRTRLTATTNEADTSARDNWDFELAGMQADWAEAQDSVTLQAELQRGHSEAQYFGTLNLGPIEARGAHVLAGWTRQLDQDSSLHAQFYLDRTDREDPLVYHPLENILDFELQHGFQLGMHKLLWGGGYRRASDHVKPGLFFGFHPEKRVLSWRNLFVQDQFALADAWELSLGVKLEHNDYTGTETLPSARLAWRLAPDQLAWAALSRAVRAPARLDRDISLPAKPPFIIAGGPNFVSEVADVFELGWRAQPSADFSYSATAFYTSWSRLRSGQVPPDAMVQNMISGSTHGAEAWGTWQAMPKWRLSWGATWLRKRLRVEPGSTDPTGPSALGNDPGHQWLLRSSFDLTATQQFDLALRRVAALPEPAVPAYAALDLRYQWQPDAALTVALVGQNLLGAPHAEFGSAPRSTFARSLFAQLQWAF